MDFDPLEEVAKLTEEYRDQCLWFLAPDYVPRTNEEALRTLELIERYGDRRAWQRAAELRPWLSPTSKPRS